MNDKKKPQDPLRETEESVRRSRRFSLAEAIGRENADVLKGASPVARARQVLLEIEQILETGLVDPDGSLRRTVAARLRDDTPLLARHFDRPAAALAEFLTGILADPTLLAALVRDADARWGRDFQERPHFEQPDRPPDAEDPYTIDGVRDILATLRANLSD